jgi:hypothetical protein
MKRPISCSSSLGRQCDPLSDRSLGRCRTATSTSPGVGSVPIDFFLSHNYPNPFNLSTIQRVNSESRNTKRSRSALLVYAVRGPMLESQNTISIDRPGHQVFAFVSAGEDIPKWNHQRLVAGRVRSVVAENLAKI